MAQVRGRSLWLTATAIATVALILASCSTDDVIVTYETTDGAKVTLLRQVHAWLPASPNRSVQLPTMALGIGARTLGALIVDQACIKLLGDTGDLYTPIWPPGFKLEEEEGDLRVSDSAGAESYAIGDEISFNGIDGPTILELPRFIPGSSLPSVAATCDGPYWLVGKCIDLAESDWSCEEHFSYP